MSELAEDNAGDSAGALADLETMIELVLTGILDIIIGEFWRLTRRRRMPKVNDLVLIQLDRHSHATLLLEAELV